MSIKVSHFAFGLLGINKATTIVTDFFQWHFLWKDMFAWVGLHAGAVVDFLEWQIRIYWFYKEIWTDATVSADLSERLIAVFIFNNLSFENFKL